MFARTCAKNQNLSQKHTIPDYVLSDFLEIWQPRQTENILSEKKSGGKPDLREEVIAMNISATVNIISAYSYI